MKITALTLMSLAFAGVGCSPALTCTSAPCNNNTAKSVQECVNLNGSVTYNFGGMSCSCSSAGCQSCATQIANYCGGGAGGTGGSGGGGAGGTGGSGGSGGTGCSAVLSGAVNMTIACSALGTYTNSNGLTGVTITSSSNGFTASVQKPGMPASTTSWSSSDTGAQGSVVYQQGSITTWEAGAGTSGGGNQGSYTMTATLSPCTPVGSDQSCTAHGTLSATMPAVTGSGATGTINASVTF